MEEIKTERTRGKEKEHETNLTVKMSFKYLVFIPRVHLLNLLLLQVGFAAQRDFTSYIYIYMYIQTHYQFFCPDQNNSFQILCSFYFFFFNPRTLWNFYTNLRISRP